MSTSANCAGRSTFPARRLCSRQNEAWATCSMQIREFWQTTTFRLTVLYGLVFALGTVALLGMVYLQSAVYLTRRVDGILGTEAEALSRSPPQALSQRIGEALALNGDQTNVYALFS